MGRRRKIRNEDGFANAFFGQGIKKFDPFDSYTITDDGQMSDEDIDNLYTYNGIAKKIADIPAHEAVKENFALKSGDEELPQTKNVLSMMEDLNWQFAFATALTWDRAFGGAAILMYINDGNGFDQPLDVKNATKIEKMEVYSKRDVYPTGSYYTNLSSNKYGMPYSYSIINEYGNTINVHESRLLVFRGGTLSNTKRRERNGWGANIFDEIKQRIIQYETSLTLSLAAMSRLSQTVIKLNGMAEILSMEGGDESVRRRLQLIDMCRHMMNTIAIDGADEYQQFSLPVGGLSTLVDSFSIALCSAARIPATILFGRSPAGQNATGESDFTQYYDMVRRLQMESLKPQLQKLINILDEMNKWDLPQSYTIDFKPLWSLSESEQASIAKVKTDTAAEKVNTLLSLVDKGIITKQEANQRIQPVIDKMVSKR